MQGPARWPVFFVGESTKDQQHVQVSHEKSGYPGWLGFIGDEKLSSYMGIIINYYKDPY